MMVLPQPLTLNADLLGPSEPISLQDDCHLQTNAAGTCIKQRTLLCIHCGVVN